MAFQTSHPLLPLILAIDLIKIPRFSLSTGPNFKTQFSNLSDPQHNWSNLSFSPTLDDYVIAGEHLQLESQGLQHQQSSHRMVLKRAEFWVVLFQWPLPWK